MDLTPDSPATGATPAGPRAHTARQRPTPAGRRIPTTPVLLWGDSVTHPNIFYRSHFVAGDPFAVVDEGGKVTVWVNSMELGRARKEVSPGVTVRSFAELIPDAALLDRYRRGEIEASTMRLAAICQAHGMSKVAVERDFPALEADQLRTVGMDVGPSRDLYLAERRIKSPAEIAEIAAVQDAGQDALARAIAVVESAQIRNGLLYRDGKPLTGQDLVSVVEQRLLELGCGADSTICCGSPDSADPHRSTSPVLRAGLPIVMDIFPYSKTTRMWGDMTRTVVRGTPNAQVMSMWEAVREAQQAGLDAVRPGVTGAEIHLIVCEVLKRHGYASDTKGYQDIPSAARFVHSTGHGLGLDVHEDPRIGMDGKQPLQVGDVITIEPGLYDPAVGGIRIEDLVVVTATGYRQLTPLEKRFVLDQSNGVAA